ncbi:EAL domain, c-di-GMP-specific phosphodiesterase class I (or its enzymatically inactive variant) [Rhizobium mongolense subsp. loessense]|uniref:EAL domain, c-di-GMP-specific phosphodiesterase class I (Or its enzymatically inactive variant) n=1 Tax=Rhizobium mongolense subsp. loessense TaxID=158890 RepID=A0A1G4U5U2_9HYPH|nr:EAL domain-containing protein [Rhizobium mongolense]SCW88957.1 EAL domain, c-di-GMP-specific phosphodiesterase class I (or its enzymatically inactive variant) [Rhizobium mongolense subsp. loessense]
MSFDNDYIAQSVLEAMRHGRIGFSLQHVNSVGEGCHALYSECLGRLIEPNGSVIDSNEFMAYLESSGNAPAFDRHMLSLAFAWLSTNENSTLGVNLSGENLFNTKYWTRLYDQLYGYRSIASRLVLEISEIAPAFLPTANELIQDLRLLGYKVAIDDFGTGFCTPESLFSIAVDIVKIDAFFVRDHMRQDVERFLNHIVGLAACAAPVVVVEGVETYCQFKLAKQAGCTHVQGFLLSEPTLSPSFMGVAGLVA